MCAEIYSRRIIAKDKPGVNISYKSVYSDPPECREIHLTEQVWQVLYSFLGLKIDQEERELLCSVVLNKIGYSRDIWSSDKCHDGLKTKMKMAGMSEEDLEDLMTTFRRMTLFAFDTARSLVVSKL